MAAVVDIRLLRRPLEWAPLAPFPDAAGGECVFLGRTRSERHPAHGDLVRLEYEAYEPMAQRVLESLVRDAARDHGCAAIRVHHALGPVAVGEASVLVQVACGHRDAAFAACRVLIDRLKAEAPIWKREMWTDGSSWSTGHAAPGAGTLDAAPRCAEPGPPPPG